MWETRGNTGCESHTRLENNASLFVTGDESLSKCSASWVRNSSSSSFKLIAERRSPSPCVQALPPPATLSGKLKKIVSKIFNSLTLAPSVCETNLKNFFLPALVRSNIYEIRRYRLTIPNGVHQLSKNSWK